jgi:hypothetical membrane protein
MAIENLITYLAHLDTMPRHKWIGLIFFFAAFQFIIMLIVAETQYPGYNAGTNYISDLGVWDHDSAIIFNTSIILFGALVLAGTWLAYKEWSLLLVAILFGISSIGSMGVGIFNEDIPPFHLIFAFLAFFFGNLGVIAMGRHLSVPLSYVTYILGFLGLTAFVLYGLEWYLGLGPGGMERMICYPIFGWMMAFGGALMVSDQTIS